MSRKYLTLVENDFELDVEYTYAKTSFLVRLIMNFSVSDIIGHYALGSPVSALDLHPSF